MTYIGILLSIVYSDTLTYKLFLNLTLFTKSTLYDELLEKVIFWDN